MGSGSNQTQEIHPYEKTRRIDAACPCSRIDTFRRYPMAGMLSVLYQLLRRRYSQVVLR